MQLEVLCVTCNDPFPVETIEDEFGTHYDPAYCPICGKPVTDLNIVVEDNE